MRVENVKGAVWTVDELEFYKRRPQRNEKGGNSSGSGYVHRSTFDFYKKKHYLTLINLFFYVNRMEDEFGSFWPDGNSDLIPTVVNPPKRHVQRGRPKRNANK